MGAATLSLTFLWHGLLLIERWSHITPANLPHTTAQQRLNWKAFLTFIDLPTVEMTTYHPSTGHTWLIFLLSSDANPLPINLKMFYWYWRWSNTDNCYSYTASTILLCSSALCQDLVKWRLSVLKVRIPNICSTREDLQMSYYTGV